MSHSSPVRILTLAAVALCSGDVHAEITGTVRDASDQSPIAGARVSVQASDVEVATDDAGVYVLPDGQGTDVVVVAANKGHFNASVVASDGDTGVDIELDAVPQESDLAQPFWAPSACDECHHEQLVDWADTAMAKAGTNTWVYDIYDGSGTPNGLGGFVYTRDSVHAQSNPASECAACHQPEPWVAEPFTPLGKLSDPSPGMLHGVSCDLCHKIADVDESRPNYPGLHPDSSTVTRPVASSWPVNYGVLGDVDFTEPDKMRASYQPQLTAAVCGTCHQDKNDHDGDGDFEDEGGVISEPTYIEWLDSPYGDPDSAAYATCVDCHMPPTGSKQACGQLPEPLDRPDGDVRSHRIEGTTPAFLDNAVTLELSAERQGDSIEVDVGITNDQTGHHVPTGVTIRNMILLVEVTRELDGLELPHTGEQVVHDLGGVGSPDEGYFAGLPGKLYAKVNHDADGEGPTFFTDATGILFDTRIPAMQADQTHYSFAVPEDGGDVEVKARLIYRRSWRALVDAKQWIADGHDQVLEDLEAPHFGHLMEEAQVVVEIPYTPPECEMEPCDDTESGESGETGGPDTGTESGSDGGGATGGGGCGCHTWSGPPFAGWMVLTGLILIRRRREC